MSGFHSEVKSHSSIFASCCLNEHHYASRYHLQAVRCHQISRDLIINGAWGVHIPTAYVVEVRHAVPRGETESFAQHFSDIFVATLFHHHSRIHSPFEQWRHFLVARCTFFISMYISCHDEAIKESICQLRSGSKYPSQVTIVVFLFCLNTLSVTFLFFSSSFHFSSGCVYMVEEFFTL